MEPARLGKYELVRHLASGGMASVYLARLSGLGGFERHVVLKTLRAAAADDGLVPMFLDEARLVATLHHQHIAQVFEVGCDDSTYFLAMEYVHGETVRHVMETMRQRGRSLPLDFCLTVVAAAAAGLHHAHERRAVNGEPLGIVHRDVTPSNVIASYDGSIKLIDFGIAKAAVRATVTRSGLIKGKVGYMAPEQVRGYPIDRRSDVFALGVLTYELTTQSRAFDGASQFEQLERTARGEITPPSHIVAGYPKSLEKIVLKALEVDPDDRYADTQAMRAELVRVARELGLALGEAAVIRVLVDLFGSRPEPWMVPGADDPIEVIETPPIEIVRPFLRARGTGADGADDADGGDGDDDDEITTHPIDLVETRDFVKLEADTPPPASSPPSPIPLPAPPPLPVSIASGASSAASRVTAAAPPFVAPSLPAAPSSVRATATRAATVPPAPPLPLAATPPLPPLAAAPPLPPLAATPPPPPAAVPVLVPSRQRHWLVAGSILLALGAITAVVIAFANTHDVAPATTTTTTTSGTTVPAPPVVPAPAVPAPAKPTPPPARRADRVMLEVTTDPPDATVVLDGVRLGRTPYRGEVAVKEGGAWLKVRKKRYVPIKQRVALDHDVTWHVELRARARD